MSEHAKTIRRILGTLPSDMNARSRERSVGEAFKVLDAILAEHRAEMETLTVELGEVREELGRLSHSDTRKGILLSTARDAALEEAEGKARQRSVSHRDWGREMQALDMENLAEDIRAFKSQPAERYLRESEVRPVLAWAADLLKRQGYGYGIIRDIAKRLGVDLDAKVDGKDVHTEHCCQRHGCKYGDMSCTVTSGERTQSFPCADCEVSP